MAAGNKLGIAARGDADRSAAAAHQRRVDVLQHDLASDHAPAVQDCDESDVLVPDLLTWRVRSWSVGTPATARAITVSTLSATCRKPPASWLRSSAMAGPRPAAGGHIVSWSRTIGGGSGLTMRVLTWVVQRWRASPRTTATPLLSCASYRTMIK